MPYEKDSFNVEPYLMRHIKCDIINIEIRVRGRLRRPFEVDFYALSLIAAQTGGHIERVLRPTMRIRVTLRLHG